MAGGLSNSAAAMEGYKLFFLRTILVPPNRFRPFAKVGDMVTDNPQNTHLTRIIETNERIVRSKMDTAGRTSNNNGVSSLAAAIAKSTASNNNQDEVEIIAETDHKQDLSKMVSAWIELQNNVNCYVDSDKDPNPLGSGAAPNGLRQVLEKKEGLFRRHMMGKRVNYCCRSVISPDPYLGTNEIGLPVHFAKTLHYPTPVNDWNFKYLRRLVERGAHEYPGEDFIHFAFFRLSLTSCKCHVTNRTLLFFLGVLLHRRQCDRVPEWHDVSAGQSLGDGARSPC
jgi:DNA-directed RNA polymerase I subunit RPA1